MRAILFDLFGVLATPVYTPIIRGRAPTEQQEHLRNRLCLTDLGELSEAEFVKELAGSMSVPEDEVWPLATSTTNDELFAFIEEMLKPQYTVGLLSNSSRQLVERIMPKEKLSLLDPLIISSDLNIVKPDPRIYEEAVRRCGVPADQILFIDDREENVLPAREVGLQALLYTDFPTFRKDIEPYL